MEAHITVEAHNTVEVSHVLINLSTHIQQFEMPLHSKTSNFDLQLLVDDVLAHSDLHNALNIFDWLKQTIAEISITKSGSRRKTSTESIDGYKSDCPNRSIEELVFPKLSDSYFKSIVTAISITIKQS